MNKKQIIGISIATGGDKFYADAITQLAWFSFDENTGKRTIVKPWGILSFNTTSLYNQVLDMDDISSRGVPEKKALTDFANQIHDVAGDEYTLVCMNKNKIQSFLNQAFKRNKVFGIPFEHLVDLSELLLAGSEMRVSWTDIRFPITTRGLYETIFADDDMPVNAKDGTFCPLEEAKASALAYNLLREMFLCRKK